MAFLDVLGGMAKTIGDKTGEVIETTKLNSKINSEKNAIAGVYKKIGEYYYQQYKSGVKLPKEAASFCVEIDGHNTAIEKAKAEIERIKTETAAAPVQTVAAPVQTPVADGPVCPACGKANPQGMKFCQECGAECGAERDAKRGAKRGVKSDVNTDSNAKGDEKLKKRSCSSCAAELAPGVQFCNECGTKIVKRRKKNESR